jgi:hypothetical protein
MKELSIANKLALVKATMEGLGFDFSEMGAGNAFEMFHKIKKAVSDTLAEQMERDALEQESLKNL